MSLERVDTQGGRHSQSLDRGLAVLRCFTGARPVLGVSDIAEQLGLNPATTHRYLSTLVALGHLERDSHRKYRLAPHASDVGISAIESTALYRHARPHLKELRALTSFTASVVVLDGTKALCLDSAHSFQQRQESPGEGVRQCPPHLTAAEKAILALLGQDAPYALPPQLTDRHAESGSAIDYSTLRLELALIARRGYATHEDSATPRRRSIAAPVRGARATAIGALELSTHLSTISLSTLGVRTSRALVTAADRLSATLSADA